MNKKFIVLIIIMIILIANPKLALCGAANGITLWFDVILPTLLPFMIISYLIQNVYGSNINNPIGYISMLGLSCGFPMGAYAVSSMYRTGKISKKTAYLLLMCCNVSSPAFVLSYITMSSLNLPGLSWPIILTNYLPVLIVLLYTICNNVSLHTTNKSTAGAVSLNFEIFDEAIIYSVSNILKMCGYIVVFSILAQFIAITHIKSQVIKCLLIGFIEITTGINYCVNSGLPQDIVIPMVMIINSFGGLSCMFQSATFLKETDLCIKKYMYNKIILALLTLAIWYLLVHVLKFQLY